MLKKNEILQFIVEEFWVKSAKSSQEGHFLEKQINFLFLMSWNWNKKIEICSAKCFLNWVDRWRHRTTAFSSDRSPSLSSTTSSVLSPPPMSLRRRRRSGNSGSSWTSLSSISTPTRMRTRTFPVRRNRLRSRSAGTTLKQFRRWWRHHPTSSWAGRRIWKSRSGSWVTGGSIRTSPTRCTRSRRPWRKYRAPKAFTWGTCWPCCPLGGSKMPCFSFRRKTFRLEHWQQLILTCFYLSGVHKLLNLTIDKNIIRYQVVGFITRCARVKPMTRCSIRWFAYQRVYHCSRLKQVDCLKSSVKD